MIVESVKRTLNEIGDTERGQYMLGRLDRRNTFDKDLNPDGKHATYRDDAYWKAVDKGMPIKDFTQGYNDEKKGDRQHINHEYKMRAMNDRDKMGERFVNFFSRNDKMLQLISEYETEGKDAFDELMDAFEEKLGYTLTDKSRKACKKAYNMWWYYNGQHIFRGMEESKVRDIAVNKMTSYIMESVKKKLTEKVWYPAVEEKEADIKSKVLETIYDRIGDDEQMAAYTDEINGIPMVVTATIANISEPEVGVSDYEIKSVVGVDDIKNAIMAKGLPEDIAKMFCDAVDNTVAGLVYEDFEKNEF